MLLLLNVFHRLYYFHRTALHWATHRGHSEIVAQLIKAGANKTITNNKDELAVALAKDTTVAEMLGGKPSY